MNLGKFLTKPTDIAPLVTFRILFGGLMAYGAIRFMLNGWIERLYIEPQFFFKFYGFEWVQPLRQMGMYMLYGVVALSSILVMLGWFYRFAILIFFLSFTYIELIDATNYLNHYYLVCLLGFLMIWLPANGDFSIDAWHKPDIKHQFVPAWCIYVIVLQLTLVYTFAGIAKLNSDWLFRAMPLIVWLPEHQDFPIIGWLFQYKWMAFAFCWGGAFYDLTVAYALMNKYTRPIAYFGVVVFHLLTKALFNIGLFPFIMIFSTLIFFPPPLHRKYLDKIKNCFTHFKNPSSVQTPKPTIQSPKSNSSFLIPLLFSIYFAIQILLPLRGFLYPDNLMWTEQGYRFSWRVMLVEKIGQATFYVSDSSTGRKSEVTNSDYLTKFQEKQMSIQPDFILQYAHFLAKTYEKKHQFKAPIVTVDAYVALNGRTSQVFIDPNVDLVKLKDGFGHKEWVLPFKP